MSQSWPLVPLAAVLTPVSRPEPVKPEATYSISGAHWYAGGLYTTEITTGAGIQATNLYRVEEGDFVYNRLFAWKGSFAVATEENSGCYVSNEFPCFRPSTDRLDARFLWRYFSRSSSWSDALALSTGGTPTSRNRLKEDKFLALEIPLPPLDEQRRIVARIEALAPRSKRLVDCDNVLLRKRRCYGHPQRTHSSSRCKQAIEGRFGVWSQFKAAARHLVATLCIGMGISLGCVPKT
jgi:type I restriction enzyme S subunit